MKHLTILVPDGEGNNLSSIIGSYKIFTRANAYRKASAKKKLFKIELAGTANKVKYYDELFTVKPHTHVKSISKTDLIIIPSLNHNYKEALKKNNALITWIRDQHNKGTEVAG